MAAVAHSLFKMTTFNCTCCFQKVSVKKYWKYIIFNDQELKDVSIKRKNMLLEYVMMFYQK